VRYAASLRVRAHEDGGVHAGNVHPRSQQVLRYPVPRRDCPGPHWSWLAREAYRAVELVTEEAASRGGLFFIPHRHLHRRMCERLRLHTPCWLLAQYYTSSTSRIAGLLLDQIHTLRISFFAA